MLIYCIKNIEGSVVYIGQTKRNLIDRMYGHKKSMYSSNTVLARAFMKYGYDNFTFEIIHDNILSQEDLNYFESFYIKMYKTFPCGHLAYNMTTGGNCTEFDDVLKQKLSEAQLKRYSNPTARKNHGLLMKKVFENDPTIVQKQSAMQTKRYENVTERLKTSLSGRRSYELKPERRKIQGINTENRYINNPELRLKQSILSKTDKRYINGRENAHEARRKKVYCKELNKTFNSIKECADYFGIKPTYISKVLHIGKKYKNCTLTFEENNMEKEKKTEDVTTKIMTELLNNEYQAAVAIATKAEVEAGAACGQLAILGECND